MEFSELLPHLSKQADKLAMIRTVHTEAINHDPAITFCQTGHQLAGRPSIGSWLSYGLGSENRDLRLMLCSLPLGPAGRMISRCTIACGVRGFYPRAIRA